MRAFIHAFRGRPWNKECCDAKDGFHKLGIETVMFTTNEEFDLRKPEDVVVGGTVIVLHALHQRGIVPDHYDYPKELAEYIGRNIRQIKLSQVLQEKLHVFVKPVEEKLAPGIVVNSWKDLSEYEWLDVKTELYCSIAGSRQTTIFLRRADTRPL